MNKKYILTSLYKIANTLDVSGLHKEASSLTNVMKRLAQEMPENELPEDAEAQQGGLEGFFNGISDKLTGGPKYPGTPEQKARFYKKAKEAFLSDAQIRQILNLANSRELSPGQKELMRRAPITLDTFTFLPPSEYGEKVGFYFELIAGGADDHPEHLAHFFDDKKLLYQLSKKFRPDVNYSMTATLDTPVEGGQNPYPALKQFILMQPLPKANPESVLYWFNNSALLEKGKNLCAYRTTDSRIIKSIGDIRFFNGVSILPRQVINFSKNLVRTDVMTNERYDTKANSKENVRQFVTDPDIIQYMMNLNSIIETVKNKINEKDPSFDENFRTLVQRNIYPDRR